jgi:hypothetical protein
MSLINDALKRARETQRDAPPSGAPPLPPVESPARGGSGWILVVAAVLFLAAICLFIGPVLLGHKTPPDAAAKPPEISAPPPVEAVPAPAPVPVTNAPPAATNVNPENPPQVLVVIRQMPKLQGIIFNAASPVAIVNGQAVGVGDRVGDLQIKQISKNSVIFQRPDGSLETLAIGESIGK